MEFFSFIQLSNNGLELYFILGVSLHKESNAKWQQCPTTPCVKRMKCWINKTRHWGTGDLLLFFFSFFISALFCSWLELLAWRPHQHTSSRHRIRMRLMWFSFVLSESAENIVCDWNSRPVLIELSSRPATRWAFKHFFHSLIQYLCVGLFLLNVTHCVTELTASLVSSELWSVIQNSL